MAGLKDVVTREYTINMHKRVCQNTHIIEILLFLIWKLIY